MPRTKKGASKTTRSFRPQNNKTAYSFLALELLSLKDAIQLSKKGEEERSFKGVI